MGWSFFICNCCSKRDAVSSTALVRPLLSAPVGGPVGGIDASLKPDFVKEGKGGTAPERDPAAAVATSVAFSILDSASLAAASSTASSQELLSAGSTLGSHRVDSMTSGLVAGESFPIEDRNPSAVLMPKIERIVAPQIAPISSPARSPPASSPPASSPPASSPPASSPPASSPPPRSPHGLRVRAPPISPTTSFVGSIPGSATPDWVNNQLLKTSTKALLNPFWGSFNSCEASVKGSSASAVEASALNQPNTLDTYEGLLEALGIELHGSLCAIDEEVGCLASQARKPSQRVLVEALNCSHAKLHRLSDELSSATNRKAKVQLKQNHLDLDSLRDQIILQLMPQAKKAGVNLNFTPWDIERPCYGDAYWIGQILVNLISNAIKYSPKGTVIQISAEVRIVKNHADRLLFEVHNEGPVLSPEHQSHLFKNFSQVGYSAEGAIEGIGLGLAFCKLLIEAMNPFCEKDLIGVRSEEGKGTTFWFEIELPGCSEESSPFALSPSVRDPSVGLEPLRRFAALGSTPKPASPISEIEGMERSAHANLLTYYIHELRTPLQGALLSLAELKEESSQEQDLLINRLLDRYKRLAHLVDTFLSYKKCLEDGVKLSLKEFNWNDLVDSIISATRESIESREQSLEFSLLDESRLADGRFKADHRKFSEAVVHLLHYASLRSPLKATIRLKAHLRSNPPNGAKFSFDIEAPLCRETLLGTLFLAPDESELTSKGFRPYIAAHLLSLMHPLLANAGAGTELPYSPYYGIKDCEDGYVSLWGSLLVETVSKTPATRSRVPSTFTDKPLKGMRLLLVEDDEISSLLLIRGLQRVGCQTCVRAVNLKEVLNLLADKEQIEASGSPLCLPMRPIVKKEEVQRRIDSPKKGSNAVVDHPSTSTTVTPVTGAPISPFFQEIDRAGNEVAVPAQVDGRLPCDLILLDRYLCGENGIEIARAVRAKVGDEKELPIIVTTGSASPGFIETCMKEGVNAVLTKPIEFKQLVELAVQLVKSNEACE